MSQIYFITKKDLENKDILFNFIYPNTRITYYISDDFSPEFYIQLAKAGFISVSDYLKENKQYLFPEMQSEYAVLDFEELHISKKTRKLLKKDDEYILNIKGDIKEVLEKIDQYHKENWMRGKYAELLKELYSLSCKDDFELFAVELRSRAGKKLIAGEIGYKIASTYTSLSGFCDREYNGYGKLQMVLLAKYLYKEGFAFWNMGHPYMEYKLKLGAKILKRDIFLAKWLREVDLNLIF